MWCGSKFNEIFNWKCLIRWFIKKRRNLLRILFIWYVNRPTSGFDNRKEIKKCSQFRGPHISALSQFSRTESNYLPTFVCKCEVYTKEMYTRTHPHNIITETTQIFKPKYHGIADATNATVWLIKLFNLLTLRFCWAATNVFNPKFLKSIFKIAWHLRTQHTPAMILIATKL